MEGGGWRVEGEGWRVEGGGLRMECGVWRVQGSGCKVQGAGFWGGALVLVEGDHSEAFCDDGRPPVPRHLVEGLGFRVLGLEFRVQG